MRICWKSADKKTIQNFTGVAIFVDLCFGKQQSAGIHMVRYPQHDSIPARIGKKSQGFQFEFGQLDQIIIETMKSEPGGTEFLLVLEAPLHGLFKDGNPVSRAVDDLAALPSVNAMPWHKSAGATMLLSAVILLERLEKKLKSIKSTESVVTIHLAEGFVSFKGKKPPEDPSETKKSQETIALESSLRARYDGVVKGVQEHYEAHKGGVHFADTLILRAIFEQVRITALGQSHLVGEIIEPAKIKKKNGHTYKYVVDGLSRPPAVLRYDPSPWMSLRKPA